MKKLWTLLVLFPALAMLSPGRAAASTVTDCLALIDTLQLQTDAATYLRDEKGAKLETQLLFHLSKTSNDVNEADFKEALRQMKDFSKNLSDGISSERIDATDAAALQVGADGVVACIQAIGQ
jgi:hypothetical protein